MKTLLLGTTTNIAYEICNCDYCGETIIPGMYFVSDNVARCNDDGSVECYNFNSHLSCNVIAQTYWDEITNNDTKEMNTTTFIQGINRICRERKLCGHSVPFELKLARIYDIILLEE